MTVGKQQDGERSKLIPLTAQKPNSALQSGYLPSPALMASSLCAGVIARLVTHPMDTLRTLQQTYTGPLSQQTLFHKTALRVCSQHGFRALYNGLSVALLVGSPASALYLSCYELFKHKLKERLLPSDDSAETDKDRLFSRGATTHFIHWCAGIGAEAVSGVLWVPVDIVKQRMQASPQRTLSMKEILIDLYRTKGFRGWYTGYVATLATFGPFSGIYFMTYEFSKSCHPQAAHGLGFYDHLLCGLVSGTIAASITCPLDVIKTRMQVLSGDQTVPQKIGPAIKTLFQQEGWSGLMRGLFPRVAWIAPTAAITIATFEFFKKMGVPLPEEDD
eukprot:TRINITY_DN642_c0_g4_i1.p1 TRINITY_DN642_c0_g4~~TRINITY_DN642_c0_g4_i1.p1  ORF type:complete len:332 (+),score=46.81 TRINITY_DN642_c0_g4_i1:299-1294(+)